MNPAPSFWSLYFNAFVSPKATFAAICSDPGSLRKGILAVTISAVVYTAVYVFLIVGGGQPFKPWLDIPLDVYYRYNVFFCAPSMFLGWILGAGVMHVFARSSTPAGTFEQALALVGFGIGIASWSTGIHDLLTSFLGAIGAISQREYELMLNTPTLWRTLLWIQMFIYLVWFLGLFTIAARTVYGLSRMKSVLLAIIAFVAYQGFFLIFNR